MSIDSEMERAAQTGTTLLSRIGSLTHTPERPEGVSDAFYEMAYEGTSSSNIGMGYRNLADAVIRGWMNDGDASNRQSVGHRRWCLSPTMQKTGFGHSGSYTAMVAFGEENRAELEAYNYIPWPAQIMPIEYFSGPWSVSFNRDLYSIDENSIKVTMTSRLTGRTYVADQENGETFNYSDEDYGRMDALIFDPGVSFDAGDDITISISGLEDKNGQEMAVEYVVHFFSIGAVDQEEDDDTSGGDHQETEGSGSGGSSSGSGSSGSGGGGGSSSGSGARPSNSRGNGTNGSDGTNSFIDPVKGMVDNSKGVITGTGSEAGDGLSHWVHDGSGWWLRYANGSWPKGTADMDEQGTVRIRYFWEQINGAWFAFDQNGYAASGWINDYNYDNGWFYLDINTGMQTGWKQIGELWYYLNPMSDGTQGILYTNRTTPDGYYVNNDGVWIP